MYKALNAGAIGVKGDLARTAELAAKHGFEGVYFNPGEVVKIGITQAKTILENHYVTRATRYGHVEDGTRDVVLGSDANDLRWIPVHDFQSTVRRTGVHDQEIESDVLLGKERSESPTDDVLTVLRAHYHRNSQL